MKTWRITSHALKTAYKEHSVSLKHLIVILLPELFIQKILALVLLFRIVALTLPMLLSCFWLVLVNFNALKTSCLICS